MITITLSVFERELIDEALKSRAGRLESMARAKPHVAAPHERKAAAMRRLGERLQRLAKREDGTQ